MWSPIGVSFDKPNNICPFWPFFAAHKFSNTAFHIKLMEADKEEEEAARVPLSEVVSDCVRRWFQDTLKEAKAGDFNMQVLLAQMYNTGYGVSQDPHKGQLWMTRAARVRSSVWKVNNKRPGYNASDSDSDDES